MTTNTPETDAETMDGSFKEQGCTITLQQWDYYKAPDGDVVMSDFARQLERERDEARAQVEKFKANNRYQRGYHDGELSKASELAELRQALSCRTVSCSNCNESARTIDELKAERDLARERGQDMVDFLSIAEDERDHYRRENAEMREAINGVSKILHSIQLNDIFEDTMRNHAVLALAKLQPFLK